MCTGVELEVTLFRAEPQYALLADDMEGKNYKIDVKEISLQLTRHRLESELVSSIYDSWSKCPIPYAYKRMVPLKKIEVTKDMTQIDSNVSYGQRPALLFCVFVDSRARRGDVNFNPLKLEHINVKESSCVFESKRFPDLPVKSTFPHPVGNRNYDVTQLYVNFLKALGMYYSGTGNGLSVEDYAGGNSVFSFILSEHDLVSGVSVASPEVGYTSVNFSLGSAPANNCELWVFGVYNSKIHLTRDYIVLADHIAGSSS